MKMRRFTSAGISAVREQQHFKVVGGLARVKLLVSAVDRIEPIPVLIVLLPSDTIRMDVV